MRFAHKHHRQRQHRPRSRAARKPPHRLAVVPELRAADERHPAHCQQQARQLQPAQAFAVKKHADGRQEKNLQTVEQRGNARPHRMDALVPKRQIEGQEHPRQRSKAQRPAALRQLLSEMAHQQPKHHCRHRQPPKRHRIRAHLHEFHNQAAQTEHHAAQHQQRCGIRNSCLFHINFPKDKGYLKTSLRFSGSLYATPGAPTQSAP